VLGGIYSINPAVYMDLIHFNVQTGRNLLVFGAAGIGKTEIPIAYANKHKIPFVYWNLSTQEAPDLVGLPMIDPETKGVVYAPPSYMPVTDRTKEPVIVIIDELDKAKPELQNPLLEVLQFKSINGRPLNIKAVFATGNLPEEHAFSRPVSHALTNRCRVFKLEAELGPWANWAVENRLNSLILGFISKNPEYLSGAPSTDPTEYCRKSPRSWSNAAKDLDFMMEDKTVTVDQQALCVAGWVGMEPATKFKVWLEHYREIEPLISRVLDGDRVNPADLSHDKMFILAISSCSRIITETEKIKEEKTRIDRAKKFAGNVAKYLIQLPTEYQYAALKMSLNSDFVIKHKFPEVPNFMEIYRKINSTIKS